MEVQCSPWELCYQEEGIQELKHSLLYTTLELETAILSAKEKIAKREEELVQLKDLLSRTLQERDEAQAKCQRLVLDKLMLQQELQKQQKQQDQEVVAAQNEEIESKGRDSNNKHFASSDSDETITASPNADRIMIPPPLSPQPQAASKLAAEKPLVLPEKGKLLQAVIEAGPLLQNLLLAGPLPQWQHPPPQLKSIEIPPVAIFPPTRQRLLPQDSCISSNISCFSNKRSLVHCDEPGSDSSPITKYQKLLLR
ncbi:uncharacterized protein LOC110765496 [Prunus avium]|uniref:Uncharacterized protein LOC110765496 n=1 Tax=Prunus avium TaxID=42229 RepID=A0A6P5TAR6_PRUAV|nr:uncharacterized protein LOC110765496 [Prunus avium]